MTPAPPFPTSPPDAAAWAALASAGMALMKAVRQLKPRAFALAVRELKAKAILLLFALAQSLVRPGPVKAARRVAKRTNAKPAPKPEAPILWRNPSVRGPGDAPQEALALPPSRPFHGRATGDLSWIRAVSTLTAVCALCRAPERHAAKLARRLRRARAAISTAEVRAFGVVSRAQHRRNKEARRYLTRSGRRRYRLDTG